MAEVEFNVGNESDGDEDEEVLKTYQKTSTWHLQDIEKVRSNKVDLEMKLIYLCSCSCYYI